MGILWLCFIVLGLVWVYLVLSNYYNKRGLGTDTYGVDKTMHIDLNVDFKGYAGCQSIQGARSHMEDAYQAGIDLLEDGKVFLFAVFDGHGGKNAAAFAAEHLHQFLRQDAANLLLDTEEALTRAFEKLDREWLTYASCGSGMDDGSTAIVALIVEGVLYVANLGDSRCVLSNRGKVEDMSKDHKPNRKDEWQRVEALGGRIIYYGTWRVEGILAVTRSFGDRRLKKYVCATPEIKIRRLREGDEFLVLASDGVWDVMTSQVTVDTVRQYIDASGDLDTQRAAENVTTTAWRKGSMDNITSMVVDLRKMY